MATKTSRSSKKTEFGSLHYCRATHNSLYPASEDLILFWIPEVSNIHTEAFVCAHACIHAHTHIHTHKYKNESLKKITTPSP